MSDLIQKVALAVIKDRKVIMVRSKDQEAFFSLGGKIDEGETDIECLQREVKEEINCEINLDSLEFLNEFHGEAHNKDRKMMLRLYSGELVGNPSPSNEIESIEYFNSSIPNNLHTTMGKQIFAWLREHNYID